MHRNRREIVGKINLSNAFWADSSAAFPVGTTVICFANQPQFRKERRLSLRESDNDYEN